MAAPSTPVSLTKPKRTSVACFSCRRLKLKCAPSKDDSRCERCILANTLCEKGPVGSIPVSQLQSHTSPSFDIVGSYSSYETVNATPATVEALAYPRDPPYSPTSEPMFCSDNDWPSTASLPVAVEFNNSSDELEPRGYRSSTYGASGFYPSYSIHPDNSPGHVYNSYPSQALPAQRLNTEDYDPRAPVPAARGSASLSHSHHWGLFPSSNTVYDYSATMRGQDPNDSRFFPDV